MSVSIEIAIVLTGSLRWLKIAIVAARKTRLKKLADAGDERVKKALELANAPNRFLATVQVGITLIGVLAGAFGGATLIQRSE